MMRRRHINTWLVFMLVFLLIFSTSGVFAASPRGMEARQTARERAAENELEEIVEEEVFEEEELIEEEIVEEEEVIEEEGILEEELLEEEQLEEEFADIEIEDLLLPMGIMSMDVETMASVEPILIDGNDPDYDLDCEVFYQHKIEPVTEGTKTGPGGFEVKITINGLTFDFEANMPVSMVFVKGGPVGNLFVYDPAVMSDEGLHAPINPNNNQYYGLSHITFVYCEDDAEILGDIGGMKFHDLNADGELDLLTEMGLQGWTIELYDEVPGVGVDPIETTITDAQGAFGFTNLPLGTYYIKEVQQLGWIQSTPSDPDYFMVELTEAAPNYPFNEEDPALNFGNYQNAIKSGFKFHDLNANGIWEEGEPVLEGWTINLWKFVFDEEEEKDVLTIVDTTTTDEVGFYEFDNLTPGVDYFVSEEIPEGWFQSFPNKDVVEDEEQNALFVEGVGFVWGPINLLSGDEETDNDFGNFQLGTKSGYKFNDLNNNSMWDEGEPIIAGWNINLWGFVPGVEENDPDVLAIIDTTTTDENGFYEFDNLIPGEIYFVSEAQVTGWQQTFPVDLGEEAEEGDPFFFEAAGGVVYGPLVLKSQEVRDNNNFGNFRLPVYNDETAWAFGEEFAKPNWNYVNNKFWGWTNGPLEEGSYKFDIYAGAGQNDLSKGQIVGTLFIEYDGEKVVVTYKTDPGIFLGEVHLWVGNEPLPEVKRGNRTVYTNAPGQFPFSDSFDFEEGEMVGEWTSQTIKMSGEIYVAAHAVVFIPVEE